MKRRFLAVILAAVLTLGLMPGLALAEEGGLPWAGEGTQSAPYLLKTAEDLTALSDLCGGGNAFAGVCFRMEDDITLPDSWIPIGRMKEGLTEPGPGESNPISNIAPFSGDFDGGGHTLTVPEGGLPLLGFAVDAAVHDLAVYGPRIAGCGLVNNYHVTGVKSGVTCVDIRDVTLKAGTATLRSGFLGGYSSGTFTATIAHCTIEPGVTIGYDKSQSKLGGFAGEFNGTVTGCVNHGNVYGVDAVGGIVAAKGQSLSTFQVTDCTVDGTVAASGEYVGGVVGSGYQADYGLAQAPNCAMVNIADCQVSGTVAGRDNVGGIFGGEAGLWHCWSNGAGAIRGNRFTGTVTATQGVAGAIVGQMPLDRYTVVEDNRYSASCGAPGWLGASRLIDTSAKEPLEVEGAVYINTSGISDQERESINAMLAERGMFIGFGAGVKADCDRTDDPLGTDAAQLAREEPGGTVTVAAYDYNAVDAGLSGGSDSGVIFREQVALTGDMTAAQAVAAAAQAADVAVEGLEQGYVTAIGSLASGVYPDMTGWTMVYNGDFPLVGLGDLALTDGDVLEFHYSLNPDGATDDVGNGWYGLPILDSFTLAGVTVRMKKETTYGADYSATTTYHIQNAQGEWENMEGEGTEASPFVLSLTLPVGTDLTALEAGYTTQLGRSYRVLAGLDGPQDYTAAHSVRLSTRLGNLSTCYLIRATVESASGGGSASGGTAETGISVTFSLLGDQAHGAGGTVHTLRSGNLTPWLEEVTVTLPRGAVALDAVKQALDSANITYTIGDGGYVVSVNGLAELDNGAASGWKYTLNGEAPQVSLAQQTIRSGDRIVLHYTDDYTLEEDSISASSAGSSAGAGDRGTSAAAPKVEVDRDSDGRLTVRVDLPADGQTATVLLPLKDVAPGCVPLLWDGEGQSVVLKKSAWSEEGILVPLDRSCTLEIVDKSIAFTDMEGHWAADAVAFVSSRQLLQGTGEGHYSPDLPVDRAMLATVLYRLEDAAAQGRCPFDDVSPDAWYTQAVTWAAQAGVVTGDGSGFAPHRAITRQELAAMLWRYAKTAGADVSKAGKLDAFTDGADVAPWAQEAMAWAVGAGLISGREGGVLAPAAETSRGEVATVLTRLVAAVVAGEGQG